MGKDPCRVVSTQIVLPQFTNHLGTIFGGKLVEMMDMTGGLSAMRFSGGDVVTASIEALTFKLPVQEGDIVELESRVIHTGKTSLVVKVDVYTEHRPGTEKLYCCSGFFTFVAIDHDNHPKRVPTLKMSTDEERELWETGERIKKAAVERKE